jgi:1-acyl-sn-glycerol-3-phosphate acyltransferase
MKDPSTARLLKLMHVITKKMFTPDVSTIMNIMRAKKENAVLVIFPEGRLSCYEHTLPVTDGTAELIKKLGVDLYSWKAEGAALTFPKWREKDEERIGKINASVKLLLTAEEVAKKDICEIREIT